MAPPDDLDALSPTELKALVVRLLGKVAGLEQTVAAQREEIARLKGLKGRPALKPSGMEKASEPKPPSPPKGRRGPVMPRVAVEDRILAAAVPPGSRFKGYADFIVQDLVVSRSSPGWAGRTSRDPPRPCTSGAFQPPSANEICHEGISDVSTCAFLSRKRDSSSLPRKNGERCGCVLD